MLPDALAELAGRPTDLLRLVAVPAFAWATWRDLEIRRVPNRLWPPLAGLGLLLLALDAWHFYGAGGFVWRQFLLGTAISVGIVVPLVYGFWLLGGFGGADVKALATLAVLYPTFPVYFVAGRAWPLVETPTGAFAMTILTNAVVVGCCYPLFLTGLNLVRGDVSKWMVVGRTRRWDELPRAHGRLLEDADGFTRGGVDLDAVRMYLRWRGLDLATLRERAAELRDPATLPEEPNPATDGAVPPDGEVFPDDRESAVTDGGETGDVGDVGDAEVDAAADADSAGATESADFEDPWGAAAFLDDLDGGAYGTAAEQLREGLDVVAEREAVWISPGIPFILPVFVGLLVSLTYGDLLFGLLRWLGLG